MIESLHSAECLSVETAGSKAALLSRAARSGIPVARGYVLGTGLFRDFLDHNSLDGNDGTLTEDDIIGGGFSDQLLQCLFLAYSETVRRTGAVIVRSSAAEEDGAGQSFAGIFRSVTDIRTFEEMLEAILAVWGSYFSDAAGQYRAGRPEGNYPVLLQEMIPCSVSGVLFTRDPVTGKRETVIEAVTGHNSAIADNTGQGERYRCVDGYPVTHGGLLPDALLRRLARLASRLEQMFRFSCDIEWGCYDNRIYLFQVRPITAAGQGDLYSAPAAEGLDCILLDRYASPASICYLSLLESWQERVWLSYYSRKPGRAFPQKPLVFLHNRVYWNVSYQRTVFEGQDGSSLGARVRLFLLKRFSDRRWYGRIARYERRVRQLDGMTEQTKQPERLLDLMEKVIDNFCCYIGIDHFRFLGLAQMLYREAGSLAEQYGYDKARVLEQVGHLSGFNRTVKANRDLSVLLGMIRKDETLRRIFSDGETQQIRELLEQENCSGFLAAFGRFLTEHGHRGVDCDDLYYPHWNEDPDNVLQLLKQLLESGAADTHAQKPDLVVRHRALERAVVYAGRYMGLREDQRYYFDKSWVLLRKILLRLSQTYLERGILNRPEEIFHMTIDEIKDGIRLENLLVNQSTIERRRQRYEEAARLHPPYIMKPSGEVSIQNSRPRRSYKAVGISGGTASGRVKIIRGLSDLGLVRPGDIGLVHSFHPSWTPVLSIVSGLLMSYGNMLSHGAVVAREYGIPVVVFNADASRVFSEEDHIKIDGTTGRITRL